MKEERIAKEKMYKKQLIIDAAEILFYKKGINETSMDELASKSGFTKKTIYRYFDSKDEIYYEVMIRAYKKLNGLLKNSIEDNKESNPIDKLKVIEKVLYTFNEKYNNELKIIFDFNNTNLEEIQKSEAAKRCYKEGEYITKLILEILKEGIASGDIREDVDINKIFIAMWSSVMGMINLINYKEEYINKYFNVSVYESLEYQFDLIIKSIRKE